MVDISQAPYFDDFDEDKGFHQILFVPARAVQVRELNQLQTMIQNQIQKFGDHVFENGSLVIPGELNFNLDYSYVKISISNYDDVRAQLQNQDITVIGDGSGIRAELIEAIAADGSDPVTFYVKYLNGGTTGDDVTFTDGEGITITNAIGDVISTASIISTGFGSNLTISEGVYYVNGFFVSTQTQNIILDKYSRTPSYRVGFEIIEEEINFNDDNSLLDNASGATNFSAPGANRRKIALNLVKLDIEDDTALGGNDFVEIFRVRDGNTQRKARGPEYNIIDDVLAQRTFDESGDYTVEPFSIDLLEHLNTGVNDGVYLAADGGDESKFVVAIEQGRAYVRGYEVENESTLYIPVDKARETDTNNNGVFNSNLGYYIEVESLNRLPNFNTLNEIQFFDQAITTQGVASGAYLGKANIRSITKEAGANVYRLYIFNIRDVNDENSSIFIGNIRSVYAPGSPAFTANVFESSLGDISIKAPSDRAGVFFLPNQKVRTLLDNGQSDTTFDLIRQVSVVSDASGVVSLNAGNNEVYGSQNDLYSFISIPTSQEILPISGISTVGGNPVGKQLSINLGVGYENKNVIVNVVISKQIGSAKTKTPTTRTVMGTLATDTTLSLDAADAFELVSVVDANDVSKDLTERFELVTNISQSFYGISKIKLKPEFSDPLTTLQATYRYFQHGSGDYFSVDSYSAIDYADIPSEEINGVRVSMSDVLDFRPTMANDGSGFVGTGASISTYPVPSSTIRADIEYYLARKDKVFVDFEGNFNVKKGESSINPTEPNDPDNAMALYILDVPAFTSDANTINSQFVNNRRYTMRDIGKLEKRIENIEYYTVLNNLEKSTSDQQIIDGQTGLNRFKNGFVADPFVDHSVGDSTRQDYQCSVSSERKELRPQFDTDVIDMEFNTTDSLNVVEHENLITLPYAEVAYIEQLRASSTMNINPYAVFRWVGGLKLIPNSDVWVDTKYTTPKVTNQTVNNLSNLNQWWRSWVTRWAGSKTSGSTSQSKTSGSIFTGITTENINASISTSTRVVGDRVVETEVIPFMRSRDVRFEGKGLKPEGRVYCFFDEVDVTGYCRPINGSQGQAIYADSDGGVVGVFHIPNTNQLRFRTGTKKFVVIDDINNNRQLSQSFAESDYSAKGLLETRQKSILTTRTISGSQNNTFRRAVRRDPLAQSFYIERDGGLFMTSADIFFSTKDNNAPVTLQIREMISGYPGPKILPYSETVLNPSEISTSVNASVATRFTFSDPVYLKNETEYCIVLISNSINYNVYVAGLGEKDISSNKYISKQPYSGVLFKSENNSTWTADQTRDMTFRLNYAEFDTNVTGQPVFNNITPEKLFLAANPFQTTEFSKVVNVFIPSHGLFVGSKFSIEGAVSGNGITASELNTTHTVTNVVDNNMVEFNVLTNDAISSGLIGGDEIVAERNYLFNNITPMFEELNFNGTETVYAASGITGKSINGTENPYLTTTHFANVIPKDDHSLRNPWVVPCESDNIENNSGNKAFFINGAMTTDNVNLSPVIDKNRIGVITVGNIINSPVSLDETNAGQDTGNAIAKYVTKTIGLKESANSLRTFVDINRPQSSEVKLYYRVGTTDEEVLSSDWLDLNTVIEASVNDSESFSEAEYDAENIGSFSVFQIKIVMTSKSMSNVPRVKNFRTIALGT